MKKFAHIINLAAFPEKSDLHKVQPITIRTMEIAREFSAGIVDISLLSAQDPNDHEVVPKSFIRTRDLDRSVLNVGSFQIERKLPLIKDILDRAVENDDADYIIYTNMDIGLLPNFYVSVNQLVDSGFDSLIITRRTISKSHLNEGNIPLMYAEVGHPHMGYDCFVFRKDAYQDFSLGLICVGAPYIGKAIMVNQILTSSNFKVFRDQHLTFHIGNDKVWLSNTLNDYATHNQKELIKILANLDPKQRNMVKNLLAKERRIGLKNKVMTFLGLS